MTGQLHHIAEARARRGLPPHPTEPVVQPGRPTLVQAIRQYDASVFEHAATINSSPLAHLVHPTHRRELGRIVTGFARCGQSGLVGMPDLHALVCLRCWPWWRA